MLLQTFVQLNILLLAAPALAGWSALPAAHPLLSQAAQVAFLSTARQAQAAPQAVKGQQAVPRTTTSLPCTAATYSLEVSSPALCPVSASPAIACFKPFPHATRAP